MTHVIAESLTTPGEWRVEFIDYDHDGAVAVTLFSGLDAETRAKEYAAWKNRQRLVLAGPQG